MISFVWWNLQHSRKSLECSLPFAHRMYYQRNYTNLYATRYYDPNNMRFATRFVVGEIEEFHFGLVLLAAYRCYVPLREQRPSLNLIAALAFRLEF